MSIPTNLVDSSGNISGVTAETITSAGPLNLNNSTNTFATSIKGGEALANQTYTLPIAAPVSNGQVLVSTTTGTLSWGSSLATPVNVTNGGTGLTTLTTPYGIVAAGTTATGNLQTISPGSSGNVLTSNGASALPTFQAAAGGGGDYTKIATITASNTATIDFTGITSTYTNYVIIFSGMVPATTGGTLSVRTSTNGGTSYNAAGSDYYYHTVGSVQSTVTAVAANNASSYIPMQNGTANFTQGTSTYGCQGEIWIYNPLAVNYCNIRWYFSFLSPTGAGYVAENWGSGHTNAAAAVNAVRVFVDSGNITSGIFTLYGLKA